MMTSRMLRHPALQQSLYSATRGVSLLRQTRTVTTLLSRFPTAPDLEASVQKNAPLNRGMAKKSKKEKKEMKGKKGADPGIHEGP